MLSTTIGRVQQVGTDPRSGGFEGPSPNAQRMHKATRRTEIITPLKLRGFAINRQIAKKFLAGDNTVSLIDASDRQFRANAAATARQKLSLGTIGITDTV